MHKALDLQKQIDNQLADIVAEYTRIFQERYSGFREQDVAEGFLQSYRGEILGRVAGLTREMLFATVLEGVDDQKAVTDHMIQAKNVVVYRLQRCIKGQTEA